MTIEEAYKLAKQNGYAGRLYSNYGEFLDPSFWQALGKSLGWAEKRFYQLDPVHSFMGEKMPEAKWYFRAFMEDIWNGKTAEEFFSNLK